MQSENPTKEVTLNYDLIGKHSFHWNSITEKEKKITTIFYRKSILKM